MSEIRYPNNRLRELRLARGLSLRSLSNATGIDFATISFCEKGKRNFSANCIKQLSSFFGVSVDYLLGKSAEEIYNGFVSSLRGDFLTEAVDSNGAVIQKIADSVPEPIRSKLDVVFVLQYINDPAGLQTVYQTAKLCSAREDFVIPHDSEGGVK